MVRFTKEEKKLISQQRRMDVRRNLKTKTFVAIRRKKSGRFTELIRDKRTCMLTENPISVQALKFKLKVAKSKR